MNSEVVLICADRPARGLVERVKHLVADLRRGYVVSALELAMVFRAARSWLVLRRSGARRRLKKVLAVQLESPALKPAGVAGGAGGGVRCGAGAAWSPEALHARDLGTQPGGLAIVFALQGAVTLLPVRTLRCGCGCRCGRRRRRWLSASWRPTIRRRRLGRRLGAGRQLSLQFLRARRLAAHLLGDDVIKLNSWGCGIRHAPTSQVVWLTGYPASGSRSARYARPNP